MSKDHVVFLSNARLSFPKIVEPSKSVDPKTGQEKTRYSAEFILQPNDPAFAKFMKIVGEIALVKWKENANNVLTMLQSDRMKRCYGQGDEKIHQKKFTPYTGYPGMVYISSGQPTPPQMYRADATKVEPDNLIEYKELARRLYGGCRVNAVVKPWTQDNANGKAVRCELVAIQFLSDDQPFGEAETDVSDQFAPVAPKVVPQTSGFAMPAAPFAAPSQLSGNLPPFMMGK